MDQDFINQLCSIVGSDNVYLNEPMKKHTTFRIGGPADYYITPHSTAEIAELIRACRQQELPYYILGNGSNLLVGDLGYRGVIIQIYKNFSDVRAVGSELFVKAGTLMSKAARKACDYGLTGLEFAAGIPGTVGGAVVMNAGAYGGEMRDVIKTVTVLDKEGGVHTLSNEELQLDYRTSVIPGHEYTVLEACLALRPGNIREIERTMTELKERRNSKQPLDKPSAGSTFKRPEGHFAGKLIMDAGLQGFAVGGAQISKKHCGFVINNGEATAADVRNLMDEVIRRVKEQFGVVLEPEVKRLGEF